MSVKCLARVLFFFLSPFSPSLTFFFLSLFFFFLLVCNGKYKLKLIQHCFFFFHLVFPTRKESWQKNRWKTKTGIFFFFLNCVLSALLFPC